MAELAVPNGDGAMVFDIFPAALHSWCVSLPIVLLSFLWVVCAFSTLHLGWGILCLVPCALITLVWCVDAVVLSGLSSPSSSALALLLFASLFVLACLRVSLRKLPTKDDQDQGAKRRQPVDHACDKAAKRPRRTGHGAGHGGRPPKRSLSPDECAAKKLGSVKKARMSGDAAAGSTTRMPRLLRVATLVFLALLYPWLFWDTAPQIGEIHRMLQARSRAAAVECGLVEDVQADFYALQALLRQGAGARCSANATKHSPSNTNNTSTASVWLDFHGVGIGGSRYVCAVLVQGLTVQTAVAEWAGEHMPVLRDVLRHVGWAVGGHLAGQRRVDSLLGGETLRVRYGLPGGVKKRSAEENAKHCKDSRAKAHAKALARSATGTPTLAALFGRGGQALAAPVASADARARSSEHAASGGGRSQADDTASMRTTAEEDARSDAATDADSLRKARARASETPAQREARLSAQRLRDR
jgi:hypothetical protein